MFDIGFWELVTIAVIGIVVVGPEKLPEVVRTIMVTIRKFRRMFDDVKGDIERELNLDEMRRHVEEADIQAHIESLNQSILDAEKDARTGGKKLLDDIDRAVNSSPPKSSPPEEPIIDGESPEADNATNDSFETSSDALIDPPPTPAKDFAPTPDPEQHADTGIEPPKNDTTP